MKKNYEFFKRMLVLIAICISASASALYAQTGIATRAQLEAISTDLSGSYILTADIDLSDADWVPIGTESTPFKGTLNGNGHVLTGMKFNKTDNDGTVYPGGSRKMGLFSVIEGGKVENLGIDGANLIGGKHVGAIAGTLKGGAVVEQCAVTNSYVETADHGGSIAGNMYSQSIVRNCYANGEVYSRGSQASGMVGMFIDNNTTISKCYFSGVVRSGNPRGIGAWRDGGKPVVEYSVNLAPYILGGSNLRVTSANGDADLGRTGLYSLSTTILDSNKDNFAATGIMGNLGDSNYGSTKGHGENIPGGDANAKAAGLATFWVDLLGWDFTDTWKFAGDGYPVLKWQNTPIQMEVIRFLKADKSIDVVSGASPSYKLGAGESIDLAGRMVLNQAVDVTFATTNPNLTIEGKKITAAATIGAIEYATVTIVPASPDFVCSQTITIVLTPADLGVIQISTVEQFKQAISALPGGNFELMNDLDFSGETNFLGVSPSNNRFTGTFDGKGKVIRNVTINSPGTNQLGLFNSIAGTIKNLGVENAYINGNADAAAIAGEMQAGAVIENCYVSNSYIEGRDHVAAIVGGMKRGGTVRNCYSNARVHSREHQAGGIAGVIQRNDLIENSYFAGVVTGQSNRAVGIGGFVDDTAPAGEEPTIKNSVSLAPYLLSGNTSWNTHASRILFDEARPRTLINNYGLSTVWRGKLDFSAGVVGAAENVGTDQLQGADVTPADAITRAFYETTLGWDFTDVWQMAVGGYPVLKWQATPVAASVAYAKGGYTHDLAKDNATGIDLAVLFPNTHGFVYTVTPAETGKVIVTGTVVKVDPAWTSVSPEAVTVVLTAPAGFDFAPVTVMLNLIPAVSLNSLSVDGYTLTPAFDPAVAEYTVSVDGAVENITIAAVAAAGQTVTAGGTGEKAIAYGHNTFMVQATNGTFTKDYTIKVDRGLFSVSKLDGTGKRLVNIYSHDSNNNKESAYRLLIGKDAVKSNDDKWCHSDGALSTPQVTFAFTDIYEVGAVEWRDKGFREGTDGQIADWKVEISTDAEDWTTVLNLTGQADKMTKYETFAPVNARYMRFTPTKATGYGAAWIYGFDIYGKFASDVDDKVVSRGKTILSYEGGYSEGYGRETPANILDGQIGTAPWAINNNAPLSVDIDLEKSYDIGGFRLTSDQQEAGLVTGYKVYVKENLSDGWGTAYDITTISQEVGVQTSERKLGAAISARYVKLEIPADYKGAEWVRIREFEVLDNKVLTDVEKVTDNEGRVIVFHNADGKIEIRNAASEGNVRVYNLTGQQLLNQKLDASRTILNRSFESGIYLITVNSAGKTETVKMVVR